MAGPRADAAVAASDPARLDDTGPLLVVTVPASLVTTRSFHLPNNPHTSAMETVNVLLLGFGNVGQAFASMILAEQAELNSKGIEIRVLGISTSSHGCTATWTGAGVDLPACLAASAEGGVWRLPDGSVAVDSTEALLAAAAAARTTESVVVDAVIEAIPANYETGEPALSYLRTAIRDLECHAITASKGPVLHGYSDLTSAAEKFGKRFLFESSVMDGVPVFSFARAMPAARIIGFEGILNSTTNIILTEMEERQCSFDEALAKAQREGIAERDPTGDVDGHDAAIKVAVLAAVLLEGGKPGLSVKREGIARVTLDDIAAASERGGRLKLVCSCMRGEGGEIVAKVELKELPLADMLANIDGASSVVRLIFDGLAPISIVSHDPQNADTAYGVFADLLTAVCGDGCGLGRLKGRIEAAAKC